MNTVSSTNTFTQNAKYGYDNLEWYEINYYYSEPKLGTKKALEQLVHRNNWFWLWLTISPPLISKDSKALFFGVIWIIDGHCTYTTYFYKCLAPCSNLNKFHARNFGSGTEKTPDQDYNQQDLRAILALFD